MPENARRENVHPGMFQNGNHTSENDKKSNLKNARMEITPPGKYQNGICTTWKTPE